MDFDVCQCCGRPKVLTPKQRYMDLIDAVANKHHIPADVIYSGKKTRIKPVVIARHEAFYTLHLMGLELAKIGRMMNTDHSSVIYGIKMHQQRFASPNSTVATNIRIVQRAYAS